MIELKYQDLNILEMKVIKILKLLKDIISPKFCYNCKKEWSFLCQECLKEVWFFESSCYICKAKSVHFVVHDYCENEFVYYDKVIVLTHYKNKIIKKLIKDSKFYSKKDILEDFSLYLKELLLSNIDESEENIVLIQTPMHFLKKLKRWYNQSEFLIKGMWLNKSFSIIKKVKSTKPQSHLSKIERIENLKNSFFVNKKEMNKYLNKTFVIVDDVVSTWSTINEIAKVLKENWAKKVYWLCIASD